MSLPNWIEPHEPNLSFGVETKKRVMTDEQIHEFLGDNPFEEWSISDCFDAGRHTIAYIVNSSMALALQHAAVTAFHDGVSFHNIVDGFGSVKVKWEDLVEDAIEPLDEGFEEDKEEMLSIASKFRSIAEKLEKRANGSSK